MTESQQPKAAPTNNQNSLDELLAKFDKALYDQFYKALDTGEDIVMQRQFENDPPAKHRYADRCIKDAKNHLVGLLNHQRAAINKTIMEDALAIVGEDEPETELKPFSDGNGNVGTVLGRNVARNELRAELRQQITKKYGGKS